MEIIGDSSLNRHRNPINLSWTGYDPSTETELTISVVI